MENGLLFDYGPVWMKKYHLRDKQCINFNICPLPDGISCGPVIIEKSVIVDEGELQNGDSEEVRELRKDVKQVEITNRNCIATKFPLRFDPYLKPFRDTPFQNILPGSLDKRFHHSSTLSSYTLNDINNIVYGEPSNGSFTLNIATVASVDCEDGREFKLDNVRKIFDYETLSYSEAAVINGSPHILLRVDDKLKFIQVKEESFDLCSISETDVLGCCLNEDCSNRFAFVNKNATLNLFNVDRGRKTWSCQFDIAIDFNKEYLDCKFGCHPSLVNVAYDSEVFLVDTRLPGNNNNRRTFFALEEMKKYLCNRDEIICSMKSVPNLPFLYVGCSDTLALMDNRYCKYPVLTWCHMLRGRPAYPQYFRDGGLDFYAMADPLKSQLCVVSTQSDYAEYPLISSISTPRHLNINNDTFAFARKHGLWFTDRIERCVCSPVVGLTNLPVDKGSMLCLQNNLGNLFYLKAVNRKVKCQSTDNPNSTNFLKSFEKYVCKSSTLNEKLKEHRLRVKYTEGLRFYNCYKKLGKTLATNTNWNELTWNINAIANMKTYSKLYVHNETLKEGKGTKSFLSRFSEQDQDNLSDEYIKSYSDDAVEQLFLGVWNEKEKDSSSSKRKKKIRTDSCLSYSNCPYFLNIDDISIPLLDSTTEETDNGINDDDENSVVNTTNDVSGAVRSNENNTSKNGTLLTDNSLSEVTEETLVRSLKKKSKKRKSKTDGF